MTAPIESTAVMTSPAATDDNTPPADAAPRQATQPPPEASPHAGAAGLPGCRIRPVPSQLP